MSAKDIKAEKTFAKKIANAIKLSPTGGHAAVTLFSSTANLEILFSDHSTVASFGSAVDALPQAGGGTRMDLGLRVALDEMFQVLGGMRSSSTKCVILITDGQNNGAMNSVALKNEFLARNIQIIVIGAGKVDEKELKKLVENPEDLVIAHNMDALNANDILRHVKKTICKGKL